MVLSTQNLKMLLLLLLLREMTLSMRYNYFNDREKRGRASFSEGQIFSYGGKKVASRHATKKVRQFSPSS